MTIKITEIMLEPQNVSVGELVTIGIKVRENTWEYIKEDHIDWQDIKANFSNWQEVKNY